MGSEGDCGNCQGGNYIGADCGCQGGTGEYFGGYVGGGVPAEAISEDNVLPQGSGTYPGPVTGN